MRLHELAKVTRDLVAPHGVKVIEVAGWTGRGKDFATRPTGAVRHWTAGPRTGYSPSLKIVTFGRGGENPLPGPLANLYQARNLAGPDDLYVIGAGVANHAGAGQFGRMGPGGNSWTGGLEIEWSGPGEPFPELRMLVSELAIAALIICASGRAPNACEHREWALPRGRKIDTNLSGDTLRDRVAKILRNPHPKPDPPPEEDEMLPYFVGAPVGNTDPRILVVSGAHVELVPSLAALDWHRAIVKVNGGNDAIQRPTTAQWQGLLMQAGVPATI